MKELKHALVNSADIIFFISSITIKALLYSKQISGQYFTYTNIILPTLASVLIMTSFFIIMSKSTRKKAVILVDLIISIILICDINYYRYFKDIPSLVVLKNSTQLGAVISSLTSLFKISDLFYLCDLAVFYIFSKSDNVSKPYVRNFKLQFIYYLITLLLGLLINSTYIYKLSVDQPNLLATMFNRVYVASELGILNAHGIDVYNKAITSVTKLKTISDSEKKLIKNFLTDNTKEAEDNFKGHSKDQNLIVLQVEALQEFVIGKSIEGQEITPNLNKLIKRSAYFNNIFYQVSSGGTSDAEFLVNNSLYPASSGSAYYMYSGNKYNSLPQLLKNKGYTTAAFHGYKRTFWNRDVMYDSLGFDYFYSDKDYELKTSLGLGLSDTDFLEQTVEKLKKLKNPYYAFLITLSSHYPYDDKKAYGDLYVGKLENTLMGNYLKTIHYTDEAIGLFLKKLEAEGILNNSTLVLYGDHNAIAEANKDELLKFNNSEELSEIQWTKLQKVPLLIHFPQDKNRGIYENYGGQIDILPTLNNLFLLESKSFLGKDLFNTKENTVIFRNGSFIDSFSY